MSRAIFCGRTCKHLSGHELTNWKKKACLTDMVFTPRCTFYWTISPEICNHLIMICTAEYTARLFWCGVASLFHNVGSRSRYFCNNTTVCYNFLVPGKIPSYRQLVDKSGFVISITSILQAKHTLKSESFGILHEQPNTMLWFSTRSPEALNLQKSSSLSCEAVTFGIF